MAARHDGQPATARRKKARGSVANKRRLAAFGKNPQTEGADWGACEPAVMAQAVQLITALGGAVTFGTSRDQGAHSVCLLLDNDREVLWFNGDADLTHEMELVVGKLQAMT